MSAGEKGTSLVSVSVGNVREQVMLFHSLDSDAVFPVASNRINAVVLSAFLSTVPHESSCGITQHADSTTNKGQQK